MIFDAPDVPPRKSSVLLGGGLILLLALNLLVYGPSLQFGFLIGADDQAYIFRNPYLRDLSLANLLDIFSHTHVFHTYVPLTMLSYSLDYTLWKFNPMGYHLTQILLQTGNAFLIFLLLRRLKISTGLAFGTALIYSIHPIHTESVAWISERKNLLSAFFILSSLFFYVRYTQEPERARRHWAASWLLFVCALLSKTLAVGLPFILILYDLCLAGRGWRLYEKIPFLAGSIFFALLTLYGEGVKAGALADYAGGSLWINLLFTSRVYLDYLLSLLFPFQLSPYYHYLPWDLESGKSILSYLLVPVVLVAALNWRKRPLLTFAVGWFVIWALPYSNIVPVNTLRQDRYIYLPSLAVIFVVLRGMFDNRWIGADPRRRLILLGFFVILFGGVTCHYTATFSNIKTYWLRVARICPNWSTAQYEAGRAIWLEKKSDPAVPRYYRKAIQKDPGNFRALNNMGALLLDQENYARAKPYIQRAAEVNPANAEALYNLAVIATKTGRETEKIPGWLKKIESINAARKKNDYNLGAFNFR
ncbi:MAG: tetratricopeptide repeat protein [Nitrospinales bacterium]